MHLEERFAKLAEVGSEVCIACIGGAALPTQLLGARVEHEAAVEARFERTEEGGELLLCAAEADAEVGMARDLGHTVGFEGGGDLFVVEGFQQDVLEVAVVLPEGIGQGGYLGRDHDVASLVGVC